MKGDFSSWRDERRQNFTGVMHQQGRVMLDADWNAQTAITNDWQDVAAQDIIGSGVAAVPADQPNGFKVKTASVNAGNVQLTLAPGRTWADGMLAELYSEPDPELTSDVTRIATYLTPPVQDPGFGISSIISGVRDAVILEVWREEINGFQLPDLLVEPALGGPDTTERVHTSWAFRLMRLAATDTCENIVSRLRDDFGNKGKLTVTLQPPVPGGTPDCPTVAGGGYTGFEHNLYRIEIANVNAGPPQFKWSQYGGGLVGRGHFVAGAPNTVAIKANQQAITNSGLSSVYLEAVEYDQTLGHWRVTYGATATLSNDILTLGPTVFGTAPPSNPNPKDTTFFRLWNGIARVQDFAPAQLPNMVGIFVDFEVPAASKYVPGDYWTFPVRAGEIKNEELLVGKDIGGGTFVGVPPKGIHYHRVPLAVLNWASTTTVTTPIEDCRHIFHPLTKLATCCSYRVGDGMDSWGDYEKIQDAIDNLPADGGEICVLPGKYIENVSIDDKRNITIKGCGERSRVVSPAGAGGNPANPVFHVKESQNIKIESLLIEADLEGRGIFLEGRPLEEVKKVNRLPLLDVTLQNLLVRAAKRSAIEVEVGYDVIIRRCRVEMKDVSTTWPGIFFIGEDSSIEENEIVVADIKRQLGGFDVINPLDPNSAAPVDAALGGLQLGGACERIRVISNVIARGIGTGITIGSLLVVTTATGQRLPTQPRPTPDDCFPCRHGDTTTQDPEDPTTSIISAGDLYDILIERNRIFNMGLNGIGVVGFFPLGKVDEFISVHSLLIQGNEIRHCLYRQLNDITQPMFDTIGYGGVALADVDDVIIRDNFIIDNGPDFRQPICGIFVLHGEGIEISRNHILNNGAKPADSKETSESVKRGRRGGINIVFALAPVIPITIAGQIVPAQGGFPALKVHDNVVSVPLGQALSVTALGPVSVIGNQFTSRGMTFRNVPTFIASTVAILNLGLSNEFYLQLLAFALLRNANVKSAGEGRPGLDDEALGMFLSNGNVLFADNQCSLDLMATGVSLSLSSIFIISLDDIGFHNNQCDVDLLDDYIIAQAILAGISVRASDNRFKESINLFTRKMTTFSAITAGLFYNTTTDNQSTHCLWILGPPNLTVDHSNVSLAMINNPTACCKLLVHQRECFQRGAVGGNNPPSTLGGLPK
jgi:hypothetical protein